MHRQVDGDVEHPRGLGIVHAEEEDVAPAGMGKVHPHRGGFPQHRKELTAAANAAAVEQLRANPQGMVGGMAHAKHPAVASKRPHAPPHLVGKRLQSKVVVGGRQAAAKRIGRAAAPLLGEKDLDRLCETAVEQMLVAGVGNQRGCRAELGRQKEAVDRREEEQAPHSLVEVGAGVAKRVESLALRQQFCRGEPPADRLDAGVAVLRLGGSDDRHELRGCGRSRCGRVHDYSPAGCLASRSTSWARISARSGPARPRASWAVSRP